VWDALGKHFAPAARCIFCGTPALVHPTTGIVFALGLGTQYGLRFPPDLAAAAVRAGAKTFTRWSTGSTIDTREVLGEGWVFGAWLDEEHEWCQKAYEFFGKDVPT